MIKQYILLFALGLGGCAHPLTSPFNVSKALTNMFTDLDKSGAVHSSDVNDWTSEQYGKFDADIHKAQCSNHLNDPIVAIIPRYITLNVREAFNSQGAFSALGTFLLSPEMALEATVTLGQTHTVSLPITFTYVSNIPNIIQQYLTTRDVTNNGQDVIEEDEDDDIDTPQHRIVISKGNDVPHDQDRVAKLKRHITRLINQFDAKTCN